VSAFEIFLIVLAIVFGSAMLGLYMQSLLPDNHLSSESKDAAKLATGLIATMAALLLGLLVSSSKSSFDQINSQLVESAARVLVLDHTLAGYGPETQSIRDSIKSFYIERTALVDSGDEAQLAKLGNPQSVARFAGLRAGLLQLSPSNDSQRQLQAQALQAFNELALIRWQGLLGKESKVSIPLLVILVSWLAVIFGAFGLFSPNNRTVKAILFMSALSVSGSIFLMLEMNTPLTGLIRVSDAAMHYAIAYLGL
jgi:uncharacterized membrane protein